MLKKLDLGPARGINKRFVRASPGNLDAGTTFAPLAEGEEAQADWQEANLSLEECPAGALVLIHGSVLHASSPNKSDKSRFIYTFHMIEGEDKYDERNWLQPTEQLPFTSLYAPPKIAA